MATFFRNNFKILSLARLKNLRVSWQHCYRLRVANPCTGISHIKFFATAAHNYELNRDFETIKDKNELIRKESNSFDNIDNALREIDFAVRRTGRAAFQNVESIFAMVENNGFATQTQSLYLLRCCGLLHLETPVKRVELVNKIWKKFEELGVEITVKHYNALLKVYLNSNQKFSPSDILISMERHNIEPNQETYCLLVEKYCEDGNINGANEILEYMKEKGISVNQAVFNSLIKGHMKSNDVFGAREVMEVMRNANIYPTANSYTILACGFAEKGDVVKVEEVLSEAKREGIILQNNDHLQLISSLALTSQLELIDKILNKMGNCLEWRQDFLNTAVELSHKDLDDIAFKLILAATGPEVDTITNVFIKQLIKAEKPPERIVKYCEELYDKKINRYIFINSAKASIDYEKFDHAIVFYNEMQKRGIPIRTRNFRSFFDAYSQSPESIWKILKLMSQQGLVLDFYTYENFVFPALSSIQPEEILSKIQESGQSVSTAVDPLFSHYCSFDQMDSALYLIEKYPIRVNAYFDLENFLSFYGKHSRKPSAYFKVLKYILENIGFPGRDMLAVRGNQLALFLQTNPEAFEAFHRSSMGQQCQYHGMSIEVCQSIIRRKMPDLLGHLRRFRKESPSNKEVKPIAIEEEERILNSSLTENPNKKYQLLDLLSFHLKKKDVKKVELLKSELDKLDFVLPPSTSSLVFGLYIATNNLESAEESLKTIKKFYPDFKVESAKLFDYARLLLKFSKFDDAIDVVKNACEDINSFGGTDYMLKTLRRFVSNIVQIGDIELAKTIQAALISSAELLPFKEIVLEPVMKIYLYREDFDNCLKEFENNVSNYQCTLCLNLLMKKFIMSEDQSKLQTVLDLASKTEGKNKVLHELTLAFIELDRLSQASKVIQNLSQKIDFNFYLEAGKRYFTQSRITELENLLFITAGFKHDSRVMLYDYLLKLHGRRNDYERAAQVLDLMKKEDIEPSEESKELMNSLFSKNNHPMPFGNVMSKTNNETMSTIASSSDTFDFVNYLNKGDAFQALKELEKMKKGLIRSLPLSDVSLLMELLVEKKILDDITSNVYAMSYIIDNSKHVFKPLFEKYSEEGNVDAMMAIANVFPDFSLKKSSFNAFLAKAFSKCNRQEDLLLELENRFDKKHKLFSISAFEELLKCSRLEERTLNLAKKYLEVNFNLPLAVVWAHFFMSENYIKAAEISQIHPIPVEGIDTMILRTVRQTGNISLGKKYTEVIDKLDVRDRSKQRAYGTLLDVLVAKEMFNEATNLVMEAKAKKVDLQEHYQSTLATLESSLERLKMDVRALQND